MSRKGITLWLSLTMIGKENSILGIRKAGNKKLIRHNNNLRYRRLTYHEPVVLCGHMHFSIIYGIYGWDSG